MPKRIKIEDLKVIDLREDGSIKPKGEAFSRAVTEDCNRIIRAAKMREIEEKREQGAV